MKTKKVPFDIYIPATEIRAAVKVETIEIEVYTDDFGSEMVTPESSILIDKTQARYMGLLAAADIRALRERIGISQDQLSDLLGCGKKSLSRWENGREYPSQLVNTLLRLLEANKVTPDDLRSVRQPRLTQCEKIVHFIGNRQHAPHTYTGEWCRSGTTEPIAM
ncbi:MAG: helix-turn-helix domain-containing protein [Verrucomicrobia bacterium]|nr:helix-turn-helix domain-containing protein [Verrucomicrobiota bacterium]